MNVRVDLRHDGSICRRMPAALNTVVKNIEHWVVFCNQVDESQEFVRQTNVFRGGIIRAKIRNECLYMYVPCILTVTSTLIVLAMHQHLRASSTNGFLVVQIVWICIILFCVCVIAFHCCSVTNSAVSKSEALLQEQSKSRNDAFEKLELACDAISENNPLVSFHPVRKGEILLSINVSVSIAAFPQGIYRGENSAIFKDKASNQNGSIV